LEAIRVARDAEELIRLQRAAREGLALMEADIAASRRGEATTDPETLLRAVEAIQAYIDFRERHGV
jgi:hypothetical protein